MPTAFSWSNSFSSLEIKSYFLKQPTSGSLPDTWEFKLSCPCARIRNRYLNVEFLLTFPSPPFLPSFLCLFSSEKMVSPTDIIHSFVASILNSSTSFLLINGINRRHFFSVILFFTLQSCRLIERLCVCN